MKQWFLEILKLFRNKSQQTQEKPDASSEEISPETMKLFDGLCQFMWIQGEPLPLVFDVNEKIYTEQGITYDTLKQLEADGLIYFSPEGFVKKKFGKHTRLFYCGEPTKIGFPNDMDNQLDLGHVILTERGKSLVSDDKMIRNQAFYHYAINRWYQLGYTVTSIQVNQRNKKVGSNSTQSVLPDNR